MKVMVLFVLVPAVFAACTPNTPPAAAHVESQNHAPLFTEQDPLFTSSHAVQHWWPANGHALDLVGMRHGKLQGVTYAPGRAGQAFTFDGTSGHVECGMDDPSTPASRFTLMLWYRAQRQPGFQYLAYCWDDAGINISLNDLGTGIVGMNAGLGLGYDVERGKFWDGANAAFDVYGPWHQVAMTFDGRHIGNYCDGELRKELVWTTYTPAQSPLWLGYSNHETGCHPLQGQIQDVTLFNRALKPEEIAAVYGAQTAPQAYAISAEEWRRLDGALEGTPAPLAWYAAMRVPEAGAGAAVHYAGFAADEGPEVEGIPTTEAIRRARVAAIVGRIGTTVRQNTEQGAK